MNVLTEIYNWKNNQLSTICTGQCDDKCCYDMHMHSYSALKWFSNDEIEPTGKNVRGMEIFKVPGKCKYLKKGLCSIHDDPDRPDECQEFPIFIIPSDQERRIFINGACYFARNFDRLYREGPGKSLMKIAKKYEMKLVILNGNGKIVME